MDLKFLTKDFCHSNGNEAAIGCIVYAGNFSIERRTYVSIYIFSEVLGLRGIGDVRNRLLVISEQ